VVVEKPESFGFPKLNMAAFPAKKVVAEAQGKELNHQSVLPHDLTDDQVPLNPFQVRVRASFSYPLIF
jgi:hypothetical protein